MKHHSFHEKSNCKNSKKSSQKNYSSKNKRRSRMKSAFWARYTTRNCAKESSHGGAKVPTCDGESE